MTLSIAYVFVVLIIASILFITEKLRSDLVALLVLVALSISGILTPQEALAGFSSTAVITIIGVFILTAALERTGVTQALGLALVRYGGFSEGQMMVVLMLGAAALSLIMNTIAAGAVLLPAAVGIARQRKISPSRLLMPLAFGAILGGMATLLTTNNLIASGVLRDNGLPGFNLLTFIPIGIPAVIAGTIYMYVLGRRFLPHRAPADWERMLQAGKMQLADVYGLKERWFEAQVPAGSPVIGKSLNEVGLGKSLGVNVVAIEYDSKVRLAPSPLTRLNEGDNLFLEAREEQIALLQARGLFVSPKHPTMGDLRDEDMGLFEVILSPRSTALGKTLREVHFREKYGMSVIAIWREGKPRRVEIGDMKMEQGDALLVLGPQSRARMLQAEPDYIVLTTTAEEGTRRSKAPLAIGIMGVVLLVSALGILPVAESMLAGALGVILVGAVSMDEAYQAIEWRVIFLIAGMLPIGVAMTKTGAAALAASWILGVLAGNTPLVILLALMLVTMLLAQVMTGQAAIAIFAPIAITTAQALHGDPTAFVLGVALASSMAFLTPLGHPINLLVMGPGGYKFNDFVKVGLILTVVLFIVFAPILHFVYGV